MRCGDSTSTGGGDREYQRVQTGHHCEREESRQPVASNNSLAEETTSSKRVPTLRRLQWCGAGAGCGGTNIGHTFRRTRGTANERYKKQLTTNRKALPIQSDSKCKLSDVGTFLPATCAICLLMLILCVGDAETLKSQTLGSMSTCLTCCWNLHDVLFLVDTCSVYDPNSLVPSVEKTCPGRSPNIH